MAGGWGDLIVSLLDGLLPSNRKERERDRPGEAFLQADISRSMDYRKEYYKYAVGIATALLAFTVSFPPTLRVAPAMTWLEFVGWGGLGVAVAAGVRVHMVWAKFYASFQKYDNKRLIEEGEAVRGWLNMQRRVLDVLQMLGLVVGVAGVISFTAVNLKNVAVKRDEPAKPTMVIVQPAAPAQASPGAAEAKP